MVPEAINYYQSWQNIVAFLNGAYAQNAQIQSTWSICLLSVWGSLKIEDINRAIVTLLRGRGRYKDRCKEDLRKEHGCWLGADLIWRVTKARAWTHTHTRIYTHNASLAALIWANMPFILLFQEHTNQTDASLIRLLDIILLLRTFCTRHEHKRSEMYAVLFLLCFVSKSTLFAHKELSTMRFTVAMISAAFPIWMWHQIIGCIHPLILLALAWKTHSHIHKHSRTHRYTLPPPTDPPPLHSPFSCGTKIESLPHNYAKGWKWKCCNYALHEISQPRRKHNGEGVHFRDKD